MTDALKFAVEVKKGINLFNEMSSVVRVELLPCFLQRSEESYDAEFCGLLFVLKEWESSCK